MRLVCAALTQDEVMRRIPVVAALAAFTFSAPLAVPAHAGVKTAIEAFRADRAFKHLSADGRQAILDILQAQQILQTGNTDKVIPMIYDARDRLLAAGKASAKFKAAESALQKVPNHSLDAAHAPVVGEVDWIPVGAEFIVTEELTADKKSALDTANAQLRQGQTKEALQTLQIVGGSIDLIFGVAPLAPTLGAVNRAAVFAEGRDPKSAMQALTDAINGIVFVSDDYIATVAPLPAGKSAK